jgi:hypothetical protein
MGELIRDNDSIFIIPPAIQLRWTTSGLSECMVIYTVSGSREVEKRILFLVSNSGIKKST